MSIHLDTVSALDVKTDGIAQKRALHALHADAR